MIKKFVEVFEVLLFFLVSSLAIAGYLDNVGADIPYVFEIASGIIFLSLFFLLFASLKSIHNRLSIIIAFGIGSFSFATNHLLTEIKPDFATTVPVLYFVVIIGCGLIGTSKSWIAPFILFSLGELLHHLLTQNRFDISALVDQTVQFTEQNSLSMFYLFISGLFPSIISSHLIKVASVEKPRGVEKTEPETPSATRKDTSQISAKNQVVATTTGEFTSELKTSIGGVNELLASVVYFMKRNFKAYSSLGFTFDSAGQCFNLNSFNSKTINVKKDISIPIGAGMIGQIGVDKKAFISGDLSYYNSGITYYSAPQEINSILAVPVISEQNELLGALVLDSLDKNAFKDQDKDTLKRFSSLAAALITNARMRIFQERAAHTFQIFYEASHQLTTALTIADVFEVMLQMAPSVAHCTRQMTILFDEEKKVGRIIKISGNSPDISEGLEFSINAGLYSFAFKKRKVVNINDYQLYQSKYYRFDPSEPQTSTLRSLIIFPILDDEGRCRGLYSVESDTANDFTSEIEQIFTTLVENASVAFTRALLYQRMEKLATTDGLTELNNHRNFQEMLAKEIERTRRYGTSISLLLMDIDHFKRFNDTYGHPVGDLVLKEIAACIRKSIRINDLPARYGGEEFTVILPETNEQGASIIAERIRSTIENHVIISLDRELRVEVSIGVASYPLMATTQQQLIDNADKALYYSKENGRNRVSIYVQGMRSQKK
jgi:two-component system cell cycle response regulator